MHTYIHGKTFGSNWHTNVTVKGSLEDEYSAARHMLRFLSGPYSALPSRDPTTPENPARLTKKPKWGMREHTYAYILSMMSYDIEYTNNRSRPGPLAALPLNPSKVNSILGETRTYH